MALRHLLIKIWRLNLMNKPKVIVADIDGTLVPRHQELSLDTINAIKK